MGFFNDLGKKTTEVTNKVAKETKLKLKANEDKGKISDIYEEMGKKIYEAHVREEKIDIKIYLEEECKKIDELSEKIEHARKEILNLNHKKQCIKCFAELQEDAQFCQKCGTKQDDDKTVQEEAIEKLESSDIKQENTKEAEIVKEELENKE